MRFGWMPALMIMAAAGITAGPAAAHPHVWIDAQVEVVLDDQDRAVAVRIGWTYDPFYSLFITGDMGLDPDGDGRLLPAELARLQGFDMNWQPGFEGDSYVSLDGAPLALGPPEDWGTTYDDAGGQITTTHLRRLAAPAAIGAATLVVAVYDPGYYTAYALLPGPKVSGGSGACRAEARAPDPDAADAALQAALAGYAADQDAEADFPDIGLAFAGEVRVTCAAP